MPRQEEPGEHKGIAILEDQYCEESRQLLSPYCIPPESPTLMFTAPGKEITRIVLGSQQLHTPAQPLSTPRFQGLDRCEQGRLS